MINTKHTELAKLAAKTAPELNMCKVESITGVSAKHAHLFSDTLESAIALTETAGKSITGGLATALATGSPLAGGLVSAGLAIHTVFSGSKKDSPSR